MVTIEKDRRREICKKSIISLDFSERTSFFFCCILSKPIFLFLIYLLTSHLHMVRLIIDFIYLFNDNRIFSFSQLLIYFDLNIMKLMHHRFSYRVEHFCLDTSKLKSRNLKKYLDIMKPVQIRVSSIENIVFC